MKKADSSEVAIVAGQDPALRLAPRLLPDALALVASLIIVWQTLRQGALDERSMSWMTPVLAGELFTLFFVVALVDIASSQRQPPTLWGGLLIIAVLLFVCPTVLMLAKWSWHGGVWMFLPFLWSMSERLRQIWTLPRASLLEKIRTRALAFDRFQTGSVGYVVMFLVLFASFVVSEVRDDHFPNLAADLAIPSFLALFFAINCIDEIRVHGEGFARSPGLLWSKLRPDPRLTKIEPI
ncbi:MAG TPA: hypothetical protein VLV54_19010 [Thermoanaerobaculia bacterium]|nr:hypothetical protein [Thermoanaerobaculia bacterium]